MPLARAQKIASEIGWLATQPEELGHALLKACEFRSFGAGQHLFFLGDRPRGVFCLTDGLLDVLLSAGPFPPFLACIARPGWWAGEAGVATGTPRPADLRARSDVEALYLSRASLDRLSTEEPGLWRGLTGITVSHLDNVIMLAATLACGDVRGRVAMTLCRLAGPDPQSDEDASVTCSHRELAEMAGLSRNSVGPAIKQMERAELVHQEYVRIRFNPARLYASLSVQMPFAAR